MDKLTAIFVIGGVIILLYVLKKRLFGVGFLTALCGFFSLIATYLVCRLINTDFPITVFGILTSVFGGLPGVILLSVLFTVFGVL